VHAPFTIVRVGDGDATGAIPEPLLPAELVEVCPVLLPLLPAVPEFVAVI
jgi:hypothetical protein